MYHPYPDDRILAIERAKKCMSRDPLFLDTETTGLTDRDEIVEIAVLDQAGTVLINSLVKPARKADWFAAAEIHGITREMVSCSPTFRDLLPELEKILRDRTVLVYNVEFDEGKLFGSADANGLDETTFTPWWFPLKELLEADPPVYKSRWHCAMELYAQFYGDWNEYHRSYTWVRLATAAKQCGIQLPAGIHRAHADAELTRQIVKWLAAQDSKKVQLDFLTDEQP